VTGGERSRTIDSLSNRLKEDIHDTDRVKTLNVISWSFKFTNPDTSIVISEKALTIANNVSWEKGKAISIRNIGVFYHIKGDYQSALNYYLRALSINKEINYLSGIASSLGSIGSVHFQQANYQKALEYYQKSIDIEEELGDTNGICIVLGNIGSVYKNQANYPEALAYYFKALALAEKIGDGTNIGIWLGNIGSIYSVQKEYSKALDYYLRAFEMAQSLGDISRSALWLGNIGLVYFDKQEHRKALKYYFDALEIHQQLGGIRGYALIYSNIANCYGEIARRSNSDSTAYFWTEAFNFYIKAQEISKKMNDQQALAYTINNIGMLYFMNQKYEKALEYMHKALALSDSLGILRLTEQMEMKLSNLYDTLSQNSSSKVDRKRNIELAFVHYKRHIILRDSIHNDENTKAQTRTEMKYEYEKAQLINEQEEKEAARIMAEETSRRDNLQYTVILIAILTLFGGVLALGFINVSERMAEGIIFFSFLILFEFLLVLADPYIDRWSGEAPGIKLLFNAGIAALIFPAHAFFESKLKGRLVKK